MTTVCCKRNSRTGSVHTATNRDDWNIRVVTELRTRVSTSRVRIPDGCLLPLDAPREANQVTAALLYIEILSPEDRMARILQRMEDFRQMGVLNLWIIDPVQRIAHTYGSSGLQIVTTERVIIPGTPIYIDLKNLFAELD